MAKSTSHNNMKNYTPEQINMAMNAIRNSKDIVCECGSKIFGQGIKLKELSALLSPDGEEQIIQLPAYFCIKCQKELTPQETKPTPEENKEVITIDFKKPEPKND